MDWLSCTLLHPLAFVHKASQMGMPFSSTCTTGPSPGPPEPARVPLLWEGGPSGLVMRTQDALSMQAAPHLCCSQRETAEVASAQG